MTGRNQSQTLDFGRFELCEQGRIAGLSGNRLLEESYKNSLSILNLKNAATECPGMTFDPGAPDSDATKCILRHGGTGFLLSKDGFLATNYHVARHCGNFDPKSGYSGEGILCVKNQGAGLSQSNLLLAAVRIDGFDCTSDGKTKLRLSPLIPLSLISMPPVDADTTTVGKKFAYNNGDDMAVLKLKDQSVGDTAIRCINPAKPAIGEKIYMTGFPGSDDYSLATLTSKTANASSMIGIYNQRKNRVVSNFTGSVTEFKTFISAHSDLFENSNNFKLLVAGIYQNDPDWLKTTLSADLQRKIDYYSTANEAYQYMSQQIRNSIARPDQYISSDRTMRVSYGRVTKWGAEEDVITSDRINAGEALISAKDGMESVSQTFTLTEQQKSALRNLLMQIAGIDNRIDWPTDLSTIFISAVLEGKIEILKLDMVKEALKQSVDSFKQNRSQLATHEDGNIVFLSNLDNAGGFSGSPVFNERGEIVALNRLKILSKDLPLFERLLAMDGFYKTFDQSLAGHIFSTRLLEYLSTVNIALHAASKPSVSYSTCN